MNNKILIIVSIIVFILGVVGTIVYFLVFRGKTKPGRFVWKTKDYGPCSKPCGGGIAKRGVVCQDDTGLIVDNEKCTDTKPATEMPCNTQPCQWSRELDTPCPTCGVDKYAIYKVSCSNPDGCDPNTRPADKEKCDIQPCGWSYGSWNPDCPVTDPGTIITQTRSAVCPGGDVSQCGPMDSVTRNCTYGSGEYNWTPGKSLQLLNTIRVGGPVDIKIDSGVISTGMSLIFSLDAGNMLKLYIYRDDLKKDTKKGIPRPFFGIAKVDIKKLFIDRATIETDFSETDLISYGTIKLLGYDIQKNSISLEMMWTSKTVGPPYSIHNTVRAEFKPV